MSNVCFRLKIAMFLTSGEMITKAIVLKLYVKFAIFFQVLGFSGARTLQTDLRVPLELVEYLLNYFCTQITSFLSEIV